jgi:hypothetical protein
MKNLKLTAPFNSPQATVTSLELISAKYDSESNSVTIVIQPKDASGQKIGNEQTLRGMPANVAKANDTPQAVVEAAAVALAATKFGAATLS